MNKLILREAINFVHARTAGCGWGRFWSVTSECQGLHPPPPPLANYCILSWPHVSADRWPNSSQLSASKTLAWERSQYRQSPRRRNSILFVEFTGLIINLFRVLTLSWNVPTFRTNLLHNLQVFLLHSKWDATYSTEINKYITDYTVSHRAATLLICIPTQFESHPGHWLPWRAFFPSYEAPHDTVFSNLSSVKIFPSAPCSQTPSVCVPPLMSRDQVSHPHKTTGIVIILYILIFTFLDSRREDNSLWTEW
jgi:hypothetical protein